MKNTRIRPFVVALGLILLASAATSQAGQVAPAVRMNKDRAGVTAKGYDVVAYFTESKPVKGRAEFAFEWRGATWWFASAANRDAFIQGPEKYAPQFGGFCAYAVSRNYTADIDPSAWMIVNGRLFLNYSPAAQRLFREDTDGNIVKADANWPALSHTNK